MRRFRSNLPKDSVDHDLPSGLDSGPGAHPHLPSDGDAKNTSEDATATAAVVNASELQATDSSQLQLDAIRRQIGVLHDFVEERLRYDEERESHFARLYDELESYKRHEASERMLTLARGLIELIDRLEPLDHFQLVVEEIEECLKTVGVERLHTPHELAKAGEQVVVGFLPADSPNEIDVVTDGWCFEARTVRPRRVVVRRHDAPEDSR